MTKRYSYQTHRYFPGVWNGLGGGTNYAQYFNRESEDRVSAMMEIAFWLRMNGISFTATIFKRYYRLMISSRERKKMPESLRELINRINLEHMNDW